MPRQREAWALSKGPVRSWGELGAVWAEAEVAAEAEAKLDSAAELLSCRERAWEE